MEMADVILSRSAAEAKNLCISAQRECGALSCRSAADAKNHVGALSC